MLHVRSIALLSVIFVAGGGGGCVCNIPQGLHTADEVVFAGE